MANILAVLPGVGLDNLDAMPLAQLMRWEDRARARAPKSE